MALTTTLVALGWMSPAVGAPMTTNPSPTLLPPAKATTTTTPKGGTTTTAKGGTTTTAKPASASTSSTTAAFAPFPPGMLAIANSVRRSPPSNTSALLAALAPLQQLGYNAQQAAIVGMGQFPVAGSAYYADDWLEARPGPVPALHPGIDIVAAMGTPLRSPVDGTLVYDTSDPTGYGLMAVVTGPDKTFFRMAHMSATVKGLSSGAAVKQGQVVGFVGSTGNSTGPHCHFETHPQGGAGVDSKPILDAWQAAAIKGVPALIRAIKGIPDPASATVPPLQVAIPVPQPAFFPSLTVPLPAPKAPAESVAGLALVGLLALLATSGLAVGRLVPAWRSGKAQRRGLVGGRDGPPGRVRLRDRIRRRGRVRLRPRGRVAVNSA